MASLNHSIRLYIQNLNAPSELVDIYTAATGLQVLFPHLDLDAIAECVWVVGIDMGVGVTSKSRPPGSV